MVRALEGRLREKSHGLTNGMGARSLLLWRGVAPESVSGAFILSGSGPAERGNIDD